jgi:thiamine biosynthesis lipoprotein
VLVESSHEQRAQAVAHSVAACALRIESKFSRYRDDNIVARINSAAGDTVEVDDETANLLDFAARMHEISDGMFDITSGVLRKAWSFDGGRRAPSRTQVDALLPLIGWQKVRWVRPHLTLLPGMQIDFGGIGKEYAVDQAVQIAAASFDEPSLVNFGGDLAITRARHGQRPWRVGVEGLVDRAQRAALLLDLSAGAIATSGDTYRFVDVAGVRLPHILDPHNGNPVVGAPRSVTVAAPTCTEAGALTSLAMLRGTGAEEFLAQQGVRHWIQRD